MGQGLRWNFDLRLSLFLTLCNLDTTTQPQLLHLWSGDNHNGHVHELLQVTVAKAAGWDERPSHWREVAASTTEITPESQKL